jgi:MFS family permease
MPGEPCDVSPVSLLPQDAQRSVESPNKTPLPWGRLFIVMTCFLADALSITVVLPMAPFMVRHMLHFPEDGSDDGHVGYYSGLVAASYTLGQLLCFPQWGQLSDRKGRRFVAKFKKNNCV